MEEGCFIKFLAKKEAYDAKKAKRQANRNAKLTNNSTTTTTSTALATAGFQIYAKIIMVSIIFKNHWLVDIGAF
jgi:hypothetical protein